MDRLEKALEKARLQRQAILAPPAGMPASGATMASPAPAHQQMPPRGSVELSMDVLESHRLVARMSGNPNADIFRILRTKVLQAMSKANMRTFAVTSPQRGDGKTTVAVNLALSLALDLKQTVLLVDLDLRNPSIHHFLGIEPKVGLSDYIIDNTPVPECLVKLAVERLVVLPAGTRELDYTSELLGSPKMTALANELKSRYADRVVIYDMPPILTQDDAIVFLPNVDGVLLVVRDEKTGAEHLKQCLYNLSDATVIGAVLNDTREKGFNRL